jgi:hypothetical protein
LLPLKEENPVNLFQQWYKSLYSPKDIAKLRFQTIGKTILYVFLLSLLSVIPPSIYSSIEIVKAVNNFEEIINTTLPEFSIENGKLVSPIKEPKLYVFNNTYVLFDPTGEWSVADLEEYDQSIGFFSDEIAYHSNAYTQDLPYEMINDLSLSKLKLSEYIDTFSGILPIIISLIILASYIFSAGIKFIEISIYALFGLTISRLLAKQVPYRRLWVLSAYSITLAVTFLTIMSLAKITVVSSYFVYWLVSLIMLYLALREISGKK